MLLFYWLQLRPEAAYLYDAVHLYAKALCDVLDGGGDPRNGSAIIESIKGRTYVSAMGWVGAARRNYSFTLVPPEQWLVPDAN